MMTTQRASLVELLRRAATLEAYEEHAHGSFLRSAAIQLSALAEIEELARQACCYVSGDGTSRSVLLVAAARVENKSWP